MFWINEMWLKRDDKRTFKSNSETTKIKVLAISISTKWLSIMLYSQKLEETLSTCDFKTREMKTSKTVIALEKLRITDIWIKRYRENLTPHPPGRPQHWSPNISYCCLYDEYLSKIINLNSLTEYLQLHWEANYFSANSNFK